MQGLAKRWWKVYELGRPADHLLLPGFSSPGSFWRIFLPRTRREELRRQFEYNLQQGPMSVTEYKIRFTELSRYTTILIPFEEERVSIFIDGLHHGILLAMAREVEIVSFAGASSRGRGRFGRGNSRRPIYHSPLPSRGASVHSLFSALPVQSSHRAPFVQGSSVPGSSSGYSGS
nr:uncharacterized protein LOC117280390 [Nicotiana tomentosiformis]